MRMLLSVLFLARFAICQTAHLPPPESKVMPEPTLPYLDWRACPFEGCAYRQWTANTSVTLYDTWKPERQAIAALSKGEKVGGVTGVVITFKPGTIHLDRDVPEQSLKRGEIILTYAYRGEGFSAVWFSGRFYPDFDISFAKWPDGSGCGNEHCAATYVDLGKKEWWAKVRLKTGRLAWVNMDKLPFDGVDMLAYMYIPPFTSSTWPVM
jgi:hypothetical protein